MAPGTLGRLFPWPFVGVVVLLVILIFLTPNLLLGGAPSAGSLASQAQLVIDRAPGSNLTRFYVEGLSPVRFAEIEARIATNVSWPPPASPANFTWVNASFAAGSVAVVFASTANPIAVNVSALYVDAAGNAVQYWGVYEFLFTGTVLQTVPLSSALPDVAPTPVSALPLSLLLSTEPPART